MFRYLYWKTRQKYLFFAAFAPTIVFFLQSVRRSITY